MGIIDPETGAIANFLWVSAQEGIVKILETISKEQSDINSDYYFKVQKNNYKPEVDDFEDNQLMVNVRIAKVDTVDDTSFGSTHEVTFYIDCYSRGKIEDDPDEVGSLVPSDDVAVQRLHYLLAMVLNGMTNLKYIYKGLSQGNITPGKLGIVFNPVPDAENTAETYAPAQITFMCKFPYEAQDLQNLPEYESTLADFTSWASQIFIS